MREFIRILNVNGAVYFLHKNIINLVLNKLRKTLILNHALVKTN